MTEKHKLEPAINEKLITGQRKTLISIWARDMDVCLWSAVTLFWQLSVDHNMDVYHQVNTGYRSHTNQKV